MVYISSDGSVGGKKSFVRLIYDFFESMFSVIGLFFSTITNPQAIEHQRKRSDTRTYAQRNQGRSYKLGSTTKQPKGNNIRGVKDLGTATCKIGGG